MAKVIVTAGAGRGLARCRTFLEEKNPLAARRAADVIKRHLQQVAAFPESGRPYDDMPELRELLIPFSDSGYVMLYRYDAAKDIAYLLAFRHQREAGY